MLQAEATSGGKTLEQTREHVVALLRERGRARYLPQYQQLEAAKAIVAFLRSKKGESKGRQQQQQ